MIDPACTRCPLSETRLAVVPHSELPPTPRVLFVGRDPGQQEDEADYPQPFIGPAGILLRQLVENLGLTDYATYTNMVKCHTPKNRGPRIEEVEQCRVWLRGDVRELKPELIVAVGEEALQGLLGAPTDIVEEVKELKSGTKVKVLPWYNPKKPRWPIGQCRGTVVGTAWGVPVIPIYHPSAALRNTGIRRAIVGDVRAVARYLGVEGGKAPQFEAANELVRRGATVAVDLEWSMTTGEFLLAQAAYRSEDGRMLACHMDDPELLRFIIEQAGQLVFWNAKGDAHVIERLGIPIEWGKVNDGMVMAYDHRFHSPSPKLGLKERAAEDLGLSWPTIEELGKPEDMDADELAYYGMCDAVATLLLWEQYERRMWGWA